jgi:hypothetical protein
LIISIISRVLFAAYFLEAGFVLIVAPWKAAFWDRNFFIERLPMLESLLSNVFVRGAVSGIGGLTTLAGLAELAGLFVSSSPSPSQNNEPASKPQS